MADSTSCIQLMVDSNSTNSIFNKFNKTASQIRIFNKFNRYTSQIAVECHSSNEIDSIDKWNRQLYTIQNQIYTNSTNSKSDIHKLNKFKILNWSHILMQLVEIDRYTHSKSQTRRCCWIRKPVAATEFANPRLLNKPRDDGFKLQIGTLFGRFWNLWSESGIEYKFWISRLNIAIDSEELGWNLLIIKFMKFERLKLWNDVVLEVEIFEIVHILDGLPHKISGMPRQHYFCRKTPGRVEWENRNARQSSWYYMNFLKFVGKTGIRVKFMILKAVTPFLNSYFGITILFRSLYYTFP